MLFPATGVRVRCNSVNQEIYLDKPQTFGILVYMVLLYCCCTVCRQQVHAKTTHAVALFFFLSSPSPPKTVVLSLLKMFMFPCVAFSKKGNAGMSVEDCCRRRYWCFVSSLPSVGQPAQSSMLCWQGYTTKRPRRELSRNGLQHLV